MSNQFKLKEIILKERSNENHSSAYSLFVWHQFYILLETPYSAHETTCHGAWTTGSLRGCLESVNEPV